MGRITHNFEIQSKSRKDGSYPIYLRITENGQHRKLALGVHVQNNKSFNPNAKHGSWINAKEPLAKVFNVKLEDTIVAFYQIERELSRRGELSKENMWKALRQDDSDSLITYIDKKIDQLMKLKRFSSADSRKTLKNQLLLFHKNKDIRFNEITISFIEDFELFLCTHPSSKGRPLKQNSINKTLVVFKTIYNQAIIDNLVTSNRNPFIKIKQKAITVQKAYLTIEEIAVLENIDFEPNSALWHTRNYFLFSVYAAGMRVGDLITLKWRDVKGDRLEYRMRKTGFLQNIHIHNKMRSILNLYKTGSENVDDYIFPILSDTKPNIRRKTVESKDYSAYNLVKSKVCSLNSQIKKVMAAAGIDKKVSFHVARHTFAHQAADITGNINDLKTAFGHSDLSTTEHYLRDANFERIDGLMSQIYGQ